MSQESSWLAVAFQVTLPQFGETERRRTVSGQHWTFSEQDHTYCRSEQRRIQGLLGTLSGGSLDLASHQEDEGGTRGRGRFLAVGLVGTRHADNGACKDDK
jgi:hypothetical protein